MSGVHAQAAGRRMALEYTGRLSERLLRSQSDERLVGLARAGHDRAFAAIVERYRPELLGLARRLNSDGRAEDVLQQAFLSAFVSLRSGTEVSHLRGWLYQIVRNAATKVRAPAGVPLDDVVVAAEPLEDVVQRRAMALSAVTELARLPERQRDALVAVALHGVPGADVAITMGLSEGALRQLVHRARTTLRGAVTAVTPWPLARWLAAMAPASGPELTGAAGVVSAGGVTAKVGTLLATGLLASTVTVLPPGNHGPPPESRSHPVIAVRPSPAARAVPPVGSPATAARLPSRGSRTVSRRMRAPSGQSAGRAVRPSVRQAHGDRVDAGDGRGGSDGLASPSLASGRDGDGSDPPAGTDTSSDEDRSASSGEPLQAAPTTSDTGGTGSDGTGGDNAGGDNATSREASTDTLALSSDGSGSRSGGAQDGVDGGGSAGSGSGGGHADSNSSGGSSDTQPTGDH